MDDYTLTINGICNKRLICDFMLIKKVDLSKER